MYLASHYVNNVWQQQPGKVEIGLGPYRPWLDVIIDLSRQAKINLMMLKKEYTTTYLPGTESKKSSLLELITRSALIQYWCKKGALILKEEKTLKKYLDFFFALTDWNICTQPRSDLPHRHHPSIMIFSLCLSNLRVKLFQWQMAVSLKTRLHY